MAKTLAASAYEVGGRVIITEKDGSETKGIVAKIIGGNNDLLLITPKDDDGSDLEDKKVRAERVRKARGPAPGTKRGPNKAKSQTSAPVEEDEDGSDEVESNELDMETLEQMSSALDQMKSLIDGHIAALREKEKPQTSNKNKLAIGKAKGAKRAMAEDEDED